jgi:hypothetical protein
MSVDRQKHKTRIKNSLNKQSTNQHNIVNKIQYPKNKLLRPNAKH